LGAGVNSITGTANQIIASASTGAVTLSLPQSIATSSSITFRRLVLSDSTGGVTNPNLVVGSGAMAGSPSGTGGNTAVGINSLNANTSGYFNTATGMGAMYLNTTGYLNTALGANSLYSNTNGFENTALGSGAMYLNTSGSENTATGANALYSNTSGSSSTAAGINALYGNTTGSSNVALGRNAGYATSGDVTTNRNTTGSNNTFVGSFAMPGTTTQLSYATALGSDSRVTTSSTVVLGRTTDNVVIGATGDDASGNKLQVSGSVKATAFNTSSDRRLKNSITQLDSGNLLAQLEQLKAYQYRFNSDSTGTIRYGVIAQEVATLFPNAVSYDGQGLMAVDYGALGAIAASGVGYLSTQVSGLDKAVKSNTTKISDLETRTGQAETRLDELDGWKSKAINQLDSLQLGLEKNVLDIAKNAMLIAGNSERIESLELLGSKMGERLELTEQGLTDLRLRVDSSVALSSDGSTLSVVAPNLVVSNLSAQRAQVESLYSVRLEAEMARIADLEVNNLRTNTAVLNSVHAEQLNTGSASVYAGVGLPALLFAAKADGHYRVSTSSLDGSYATATVIVNAGQAKVVPGVSEGIELFASGNLIKVNAAGKLVKASWIKMG
jgi:hypothetical protein